ncbi:S-layer homology domain-containing protein [Abyssisolibacter fermentans]|uniref:S-layer homology domain-containing protein n=1 Tax=Abyssisolibacter fermentans TaxID=1766203 RepID=UPI0008327400|nr:S-layer homology domain-containing protein [Abyssisolibacter fermentans]
MKKIIRGLLLVFFVMNFVTLQVNAENVQKHNEGHLIDGLVPEDSMYYNGHTYLAFKGNFTWYQAKTLCEDMGGYLVTLDTYDEQVAVTNLSTLGWTGACAFSGGNTRAWVWNSSGNTIGIMHEPEEGVEGDKFYFTPISDNIWDSSTNEPNSWKSPWDQNVAELNKRGLNSLRPSDSQGFICEFDKKYVFSVVDLNFDMNFCFELEDGFNKVWAEYPANYSDCLPKKVFSTFGKTNITPEYPNNKQEKYNFRGYSINKNTTPIWLNSHNALHMDNSNWYIRETALDKPVVILYAVWEKAESKPFELECFAASMFAYSKKLEKGKTVSETLNLQENLSWKDIDKDLPRFKGYGHVTMRDFINAVIGGYVVEDFVRYDNGSTFSVVYLKNCNDQGIIAYRGTEISMWQSIKADLLMGNGQLNVQFDHALDFYAKHNEDAPVITGHSLGGALASHVCITNDVPCYTINSAQGFSIPLTLIKKYGSKDEMNKVFSFCYNEISNLIDNYVTKTFLPDVDSFEDESVEIFSSYNFYYYQPKLHSYAHECDIISKPNRANVIFEILSGEKIDWLTAHNIDRMIAYDENTNRYSIVQTTREFPKKAHNYDGDMPSSWAYDAYAEAANKGLIIPEINVNYRGETSRVDFCRAAVNFIEKYYNKTIMDVLKERDLNLFTFKDTDDEAIRAAAALGITSGTDVVKKLFSPDASITREQAATMLVNILKTLEVNFDTKPVMWSDAQALSPWALDSVNAIYNAGVMKGTCETKLDFSPKLPYTHEQTIVTLNGLWNYLNIHN